GAPAAAPQVLAVSVAPVEARSVQRSVETTGSLLPWEEVVLNTPVAGTLARLLVDLGDRVQAGQVVAELDKREFALAVAQAEAALKTAQDSLERARAQAEASRAALQQVQASRGAWEAGVNRARAVLEEARLNLDRARSLLDQQLIARREFDAARTQFETALAQYQTAEVELAQYPDRVRVAQAQLASDLSAVQVAESEIKRREAELALARKKLADATLRAPIRGAVARRHVNPGEFLRENTPVLTIVRGDPLKYAGTVPERAALDLRPGQPVRLEVDVAPGRAFEGRVVRVSPAVDVSTRTVTLEAEVANREGLLKPGLFARGAVVTGQQAAVPFVPESAVSYTVGITKVFVVAGGRAEERTVRLGGRREGMVEVLDGLRPGELVATSQLAQLYDGAPVRVAAAAPAADG
ncbi:MAG TPA: efflux RND transporter periplasmic adaptor subunit, partial [Thermodesulfobacteriota bacterium]|nr:efflux RND transporter periplasmic adaptor subunit [Thermodesulfobacteriota bacterium]